MKRPAAMCIEALLSDAKPTPASPTATANEAPVVLERPAKRSCVAPDCVSGPQRRVLAPVCYDGAVQARTAVARFLALRAAAHCGAQID